MKHEQKIALAAPLARGGLLACCQNYRCGHRTAISGDRWPDEVRLSDLEPLFTCEDCGKGADVRPDYIQHQMPRVPIGLSGKCMRTTPGGRSPNSLLPIELRNGMQARRCDVLHEQVVVLRGEVGGRPHEIVPNGIPRLRANADIASCPKSANRRHGTSRCRQPKAGRTEHDGHAEVRPVMQPAKTSVQKSWDH